jgi:hypothetical protein
LSKRTVRFVRTASTVPTSTSIPKRPPKLNQEGKVTNDVIVLGTVAKLIEREAHRLLHIPGAAEPTNQTYRYDD